MYATCIWRRTNSAITASLRPFTLGLLFMGLLVSVASATELGASVYPAGVETVMPGMTPGPGASFLGEFTNFYQANSLVNSTGHSEVPGFHLGVTAVALKFVHNWGVHVLGGTLVSYGALPVLYESLKLPFGQGAKTGFGNPDIQPVAVAYVRSSWHWWYGMDVFTPGFQYDKNALINIGQHNFAYAPSGAFTYLSHHGTEVSSKVQYIINGKDNQTQYQSGHELVWEHDAMQNIGKKLSVGINGFFYKQTSNDMQNGAIVGDGYRGRDFGFGPEIHYHLGHVGLIAKYQRDLLVQNRPVGNSFWLQVGLPLGHPHE